MQKIWYIEVNNHRQGPFSVKDLKRDRRITPDTLVWKEGFDFWKPIRDVPELKELFVKDEEPSEDSEAQGTPGKKLPTQDEIVLDAGEEPPYFFWILIAVIVITYAFSQLYWK